METTEKGQDVVQAQPEGYRTDDSLVVLLYLLLRDHLPAGALYEVVAMMPAGTASVLSSPPLARLAEDIAASVRLQPAGVPLMPVPRCDACAWWVRLDVHEKGPWGQCRRGMAIEAEHAKVQAVGNSRGMPVPAELRTLESFGCVQFEERT